MGDDPYYDDSENVDNTFGGLLVDDDDEEVTRRCINKKQQPIHIGAPVSGALVSGAPVSSRNAKSAALTHSKNTSAALPSFGKGNCLVLAKTRAGMTACEDVDNIFRLFCESAEAPKSSTISKSVRDWDREFSERLDSLDPINLLGVITSRPVQFSAADLRNVLGAQFNSELPFNCLPEIISGRGPVVVFCIKNAIYKHTTPWGLGRHGYLPVLKHSKFYPNIKAKLGRKSDPAPLFVEVEKDRFVYHGSYVVYQRLFVPANVWVETFPEVLKQCLYSDIWTSEGRDAWAATIRFGRYTGCQNDMINRIKKTAEAAATEMKSTDRSTTIIRWEQDKLFDIAIMQAVGWDTCLFAKLENERLVMFFVAVSIEATLTENYTVLSPRVVSILKKLPVMGLAGKPRPAKRLIAR